MHPKCYSYIRFSTQEQSNGDSLRRQSEMSEDYAKKHGLELDPMSDLGMSAFKGTHRTKGALGRFLDLVRAGEITKGSTLLVESLDRLSREPVGDAYAQVLEITNAGIRIVTLEDNVEYTRASLNSNFGQLMISLVKMSTANQESATKSRRGKANWVGKRERIEEKKLTSKAPAWLLLNEKRTAFIVIPERGEIIRRIYELKASGMGSDSIAKRLNREAASLPPGSFWMPDGRKGEGTKIPGWRKTYVTKILRTPAVIGHYQPHKMNDDCEDPKFRKREPVGPVITDYFPAVVPEDLFYKVQGIYERNRRGGYGSGQNGKISNLFGSIAKCGYCGSSMEFVPKGKPPKGGTYYACDAGRRELGCKRHYLPYPEIEELVLRYCRGLNAADILPGNEEREAALRLLRGRLVSVEGKLKQAERDKDNLLDSITTTGSAEVRRALEGRLEKTLKEKGDLEAEAKQLGRNIKRESVAQEDANAQLQSFRDLFGFFKEAKGEELIDVRRKLREELRGLIEQIDVYPVGQITLPMNLTGQRVLEAQGDVSKLKELLAQDRIEELKSRTTKRHGGLREFVIRFKSGSWRTLAPRAPHTLVCEVDGDKGEIYDYFQFSDGSARGVTKQLRRNRQGRN